MSRVTSQAKERRRLPHQAVGHRAVWLVADRAILGHRWMFVRERPLLVGMAPVADEIDRRFLEIPFGLPVTVVTVGAEHLAFLDRMVVRHRNPGVDVAVALVTHVGLVHGHRHPRRAADVRMLDVDERLDVQIGMRVVTVGAGHIAE